MRVGEAAALRVKSLDLLKRRVQILEVSKDVNGHLYTGPTKNRRGRSVILPAFLAEELGPRASASADVGGLPSVITSADRYQSGSHSVLSTEAGPTRLAAGAGGAATMFAATRVIGTTSMAATRGMAGSGTTPTLPANALHAHLPAAIPTGSPTASEITATQEACHATVVHTCRRTNPSALRIARARCRRRIDVTRRFVSAASVVKAMSPAIASSNPWILERLSSWSPILGLSTAPVAFVDPGRTRSRCRISAGTSVPGRRSKPYALASAPGTTLWSPSSVRPAPFPSADPNPKSGKTTRPTTRS